jgi:hypothetical protein
MAVESVVTEHQLHQTAQVSQVARAARAHMHTPATGEHTPASAAYTKAHRGQHSNTTYQHVVWLSTEHNRTPLDGALRIGNAHSHLADEAVVAEVQALQAPQGHELRWQRPAEAAVAGEEQPVQLGQRAHGHREGPRLAH